MFLKLYLKEIRSSFVTADRDRSNSLSYYEVQEALQRLGYQLSNNTANVIFRRFDEGRTGQIDWNNFIRLGAYVASLKTVFQWYFYQNLSNKKHKKEKVTLKLPVTF